MKEAAETHPCPVCGEGEVTVGVSVRRARTLQASMIPHARVTRECCPLDALQEEELCREAEDEAEGERDYWAEMRMEDGDR